VLRTKQDRVSGEYGEYVVEQHYGGERFPKPNNKGCDILLPDGRRAEVKTRRVETRTPKWFGPMRSLTDQEQPFELLVAVLFDPDFAGAQVWAMDWNTARRHAKKYANTLPYTGAWREDPPVERFRLSA